MRFLNTTKFSVSGEFSSGRSEFEQARHAVFGLTAELNTARAVRRIRSMRVVFIEFAMLTREVARWREGADCGRGGHGPFEMTGLRV
jgi:hypothetical protein